MFYRYVNEFWYHGSLGVNFFFVLSGFLITFLLLNEEKYFGKINIKSFYIRRTLRIWPLFFLTVLFGFLLFPILKSAFGGIPNESAELIYYLTFLSNFDIINNGMPDSSILSVLWSVSVEEQFYLFWPWLLFILKPKRYPLLFLFIIIISVLFRYLNLDSHPHVLKVHTLSVISDMAMGGLTAYYCFFSDLLINAFKRLRKYQIFLIYTAGFFMVLYSGSIFNNPVMHVFKNVIQSLFFIFIILEQNYSDNSFYKVGKWKIIGKLGQWTYGLYCLHFIGILAATNISKLLNMNNTVFGVVVFETALALGITILISYLSFTFFENPFLKLKSKFSVIVQKGDR